MSGTSGGASGGDMRAMILRVAGTVGIFWALGAGCGTALGAARAHSPSETVAADTDGRAYLLANGGAASGRAANDGLICEESTATRREITRVMVHGRDTEAARRQEVAGLDAWIAKHPDDVFARLERLDQNAKQTERDAAIAEYKELLDRHPNDPAFEFLYAVTLVDTRTAEALERLKKIPADARIMPEVYLELEWIYRWGKFEDRSEGRKQLIAYRDACPNSLTRWQGVPMRDYATAELATKYAAQMRSRLKGERDVAWLTAWNTVWTLDFIGTPPEKQDELRTRIDEEVRQLRASIRSDEIEWLGTVKAGFHYADDKNSEREVADLIVSKYPESWNAEEIANVRWSKEHPFPKADAPAAEKYEFYRAVYERAKQRVKKEPTNSEFMWAQVTAMRQLYKLRTSLPAEKQASIEESLPVAELVDVGERLRTSLQGDVAWMSNPPGQFDIAEAYLDRGVRVDEVPQLIEEGRAAAERYRAYEGSDRTTEEVTKMYSDANAMRVLSGANLLVDAARQSGRPEMAKAAMEEMESLNYEKSEEPNIWKVKGKWAEVNGHKLDAMFMYRAAIDSRPKGFQMPPGDVDEVKESYARLWKELGGSDEGRQAWLTGVANAQVAGDARWEKASKDLPAWSLTDLQGKTWKLVDFKGKAMLINVWATWCGPCQAEHPYLQKFYELVKDRSDIQVVTFNIDDSAADVGPYMKDKHYTFPVLLAKDFVNDLLPLVSVPQNWVVDQESKWKWSEVGFNWEGNFDKEWMEKLGVK
jgi:cytochrome c biogenesis protein CcmG/thiol:disulfide interchange protein DsbE